MNPDIEAAQDELDSLGWWYLSSLARFAGAAGFLVSDSMDSYLLRKSVMLGSIAGKLTITRGKTVLPSAHA